MHGHRIERSLLVVPPIDNAPTAQIEGIIGEHIGVSLKNFVSPVNGFKIVVLLPIDAYATIGRNPDAVLCILDDKLNEVSRQSIRRVGHCRVVLEFVVVIPTHPRPCTYPQESLVVKHNRAHEIL